MSQRPIVKPHPVIVNGAMAASLTSEVTLLQSLSCCSYAVSWTGASPVGSVAIQASNDYSINSTGSVNNAGTWTSLYFSVNGTTANTMAVSGNTGTGFADIALTGAYAIRLVYTAVSGTGTLNATIVAKVA